MLGRRDTRRLEHRQPGREGRDPRAHAVIRREINYGLRFLGILINDVKQRTNYGRKAEEFLRGKHGDQVLGTTIASSVAVPDAKRARQPLSRM